MASIQQFILIAWCLGTLSRSQRMDVTIAFPPEDVEAHEHSDVKFICILHGELTDLDKMTFMWYKDGDPFIPDYNAQERYDTVEGNLILDIFDVKLSDTGQYQCIIKYNTQVIAVSRSGHLTVQDIPDKRYPQCIRSKQIYADGEEVILSCISETRGDLKMQWPDAPEETKLTLLEEKDYTTLFASFQATKQEHGQYHKCLMKMEGEQLPRVCLTQTLNVTNELHVYITTSDFTDNSLNITCNTEEQFENVTYNWMFNNCSSDTTNKFQIINKIVYINTLAMYMNGCQLTCNASKNMATGNYTYILKGIQHDLQPSVDTLFDKTSTNQDTKTNTKLLVAVFGFCFVVVVVATLLVKYKGKHSRKTNLPGLTPIRPVATKKTIEIDNNLQKIEYVL